MARSAVFAALLVLLLLLVAAPGAATPQEGDPDVLLDDFEDDDWVHAFGGSWQVADDADEGGNSVGSITRVEGRDGQVLHFEYDLRGAKEDPHCFLGLFPSPQFPAAADLSAARGLRFFARGGGLRTLAVGIGAEGGLGIYATTVDCGEDWGEFTVPFSDFAKVAGPGGERLDTRVIAFIAFGAELGAGPGTRGEFELDDVHLWQWDADVPRRLPGQAGVLAADAPVPGGDDARLLDDFEDGLKAGPDGNPWTSMDSRDREDGGIADLDVVDGRDGDALRVRWVWGTGAAENHALAAVNVGLGLPAPGEMDWSDGGGVFLRARSATRMSVVVGSHSPGGAGVDLFMGTLPASAGGGSEWSAYRLDFRDLNFVATIGDEPLPASERGKGPRTDTLAIFALGPAFDTGKGATGELLVDDLWLVPASAPEAARPDVPLVDVDGAPGRCRIAWDGGEPTRAGVELLTGEGAWGVAVPVESGATGRGLRVRGTVGDDGPESLLVRVTPNDAGDFGPQLSSGLFVRVKAAKGTDAVILAVWVRDGDREVLYLARSPERVPGTGGWDGWFAPWSDFRPAGDGENAPDPADLVGVGLAPAAEAGISVDLWLDDVALWED